MRLFKYFIVLACLFIVACDKASHDAKHIRVGTIAGPESRLMQVAKHVAAAKYGLKVEVIEFNDYLIPNTALAEGSIDANMFQHQAYLDQTIANKGYALVSIGKTFIYPMGVYSKRLKSLESLAQHATIAIPNDPSNGARALLLLQGAGLIKLDSKAKSEPSLKDITSNPKQLKFTELDAAQLAHALDDVDLAAINTNYALVGGLSPSRDALFVEDESSPYANVIVVRKADNDSAKLKQLVAAIQSRDVLHTADSLFHGEAIPAWGNNSK
jgi:D-methionine transport system substrate-binding protein